MIEILRILLFETMETDPIYFLCANLFIILDGADTKETTDVYYNMLFGILRAGFHSFLTQPIASRDFRGKTMTRLLTKRKPVLAFLSSPEREVLETFGLQFLHVTI